MLSLGKFYIVDRKLVQVVFEFRFFFQTKSSTTVAITIYWLKCLRLGNCRLNCKLALAIVTITNVQVFLMHAMPRITMYVI